MAEPLQPEDYLRIARRRLPVLLATFLTIAVIAVSIVMLLPPIYRSTGTIAIESQQIPADLIRSTVSATADQRIGFVNQIVMTDSRLEEIVDKHGLYPEERAVLPMMKVVEKLRENVVVASVVDPYATQATIAFTVSFDHTDPEVARNVAQELTDLFLAENVRTRNARATDTAAFLRRETARLSDEVRSLDQRVADFKRANSDALPEHLDLRVSMLQNAEFDLRAVQREISATEQERRFMEIQLERLTSRPPVRSDLSLDEMDPEQRLQALRADLVRASGLYTEAHPDIARLKRMIGQAEAELERVGAGEHNADSALPRDPERAQIDIKRASLDTRLHSLRDQEQELSNRIARLQAEVLQTPEVELGLRELEFNYESTSKEYEKVREKLQQAELAENLETEQMAERFLLLEPPVIPVEPHRPNRLKLFALSLMLAMAGGAGAAFAAEWLDKKIRDTATLTALIGERPLAVLPYITLPHEYRARIAKASGRWVAFVSFLAVAVMIGHRYAGLLEDMLIRVYY